MRVDHRFDITADDATVWRALADVAVVISCVPGARVIGRRDDGRYDAAIGIRYGHIGLEFRGVAAVTYDDGSRVIRIYASGNDRSGATRAAADLSLDVRPHDGHLTALRLDGSVDLAGALAHVPAVGADALVARLMTSFAERLAARIEGGA